MSEWYFDFVSPFSYLQLRGYGRLPAAPEVRRVPIVFGALLDHYGTTGPAEVPPKRLHTYRLCKWLADQQGLSFVMPPAHPFNPLRALRLALVAGPSAAVVEAIFDAIWARGEDLNQDEPFLALAAHLGVTEALRRVAEPTIKAQLKANTDAAIVAGVFGVPSFVAGGQVFWGVDATGMYQDYLHDPMLFDATEFARYPDLPVGADRRR